MSKTLNIKITDAVIKQTLGDSSIRQIRDPRYPLYFIVNRTRTGGSWTYVHYQHGKQYRRKIGSYPALKSKRLFDALPEIIQSLAISVKRDIQTDSFLTLNEILNWYLNRSLTDRRLSRSRKTDIKYVITKYLIPNIGNVNIKTIDHHLIDTQLMWPLQQQLNVSTVQTIFKVLKQTTKQAKKLKMIATDPFAAINFSDFIQARISAKDGALRAEHLAILAQQWQKHEDKTSVILAVMMLCCGTRLGETRQAKWQDIDSVNNEWFIPAKNTKTRQAHRVPVTDELMQLLVHYRSMATGAFLFGKFKPLSAVQASQLVKQLSGGQWTAHDLRKLARTIWADSGVDYMIAEMLLNHKLSKIDQAYIHTYAEQQKRKALNQYHSQLLHLGFFLCLNHDTNLLSI